MRCTCNCSMHIPHMQLLHAHFSTCRTTAPCTFLQLLHAHSAHATAPCTFSTCNCSMHISARAALLLHAHFCNCSMHIQHLHVLLAQARPTMSCIPLVTCQCSSKNTVTVIMFTNRAIGNLVVKHSPASSAQYTYLTPYCVNMPLNKPYLALGSPHCQPIT